jgi:hypothetical protein
VLSVEEGVDALLALRSKPPLYPTVAGQSGLGRRVRSAIALILQPAWPNLAFTVLGRGLRRRPCSGIGQRVSLIATLLPVLAAFVLACAAVRCHQRRSARGTAADPAGPAGRPAARGVDRHRDVRARFGRRWWRGRPG